MGLEGDCHVDGVKNPPEHGLACGPWAVPCLKFIKREDFLVLLGVLPVNGPEHLVECVEERAADMAVAVPWPLRQS